MIFGFANVKLQSGRDVLVSHDILDLVHRHTIVGEPRALGVAQVMEFQPATLIT